MSKDRPVLIGLGELLWDCFGAERRPGGAPANVAFHANQLGLRGLVCTRVGRDELGDELIAHLTRHRLDVTCVQRDDAHPTSTVDVHDDGDGPMYTIHENVAWDYLAVIPAWEDALRHCTAIAFGTLAQRYRTSRVTIHQCLELAAHALRLYDVNLRPPFVDREWIAQSLEHATVMKLNHDELPIIADMFGVVRGDMRTRAEGLRTRFGLQVVCITRGKDGCLLVSDASVAETVGKTVDVADTVGAGDAFTAALAAGLIWQWPLESVAKLANAVGGLVASRPGAMPDLREELARCVAEHRPGGAAD